MIKISGFPPSSDGLGIVPFWRINSPVFACHQKSVMAVGRMQVKKTTTSARITARSRRARVVVSRRIRQNGNPGSKRAGDSVSGPLQPEI